MLSAKPCAQRSTPDAQRVNHCLPLPAHFYSAKTHSGTISQTSPARTGLFPSHWCSREILIPHGGAPRPGVSTSESVGHTACGWDTLLVFPVPPECSVCAGWPWQGFTEPACPARSEPPAVPQRKGTQPYTGPWCAPQEHHPSPEPSTTCLLAG